MCIFTKPVWSVETTRIFARMLTENVQALIYQMRYESFGVNAMILPIPTPPNVREDSVRFFDFSDYHDFFKDVEKTVSHGRTRSRSMSKSVYSLEVIDVGSYIASFVPRLEDFPRLSSEYQLSSEIWDNLPWYRDYSFVVFQLKEGSFEQHPMAFSFPTRISELYFPTFHIHGGDEDTVLRFERYDHKLYFQDPQMQTKGGKAGQFLKINLCHGLVDPDLGFKAISVHGHLPNGDIIIQDFKAFPYNLYT